MKRIAYSRMMYNDSVDLTKPLYLTIFGWLRFLSRSISICRLKSTPVAKGKHIARDYNDTMIARDWPFGRSANLTCLIATVSPVPQFKARYTLPKAPLPRQSPSCCELLSARRPSTMFQAWQILSYVVFEAGNLTSSPLYSPVFWHLFPTRLSGLGGWLERGLWLVAGSSFEGGCKSFAAAFGLDRRPGRAIGRLRALGDSRHGGRRV